MPVKPSEIIIISGFLGSGKTTLLKRFLDWELDRGAKPRVIMSEFGDLDVDGSVIADERLDVMAITGGCVCCSNKDELADAIAAMAAEDPGSRIYIETTGLADPAGVLATIAPLTGPDTAVIRKVLVVYDADRHGRFGRDQFIVEKQVMTADMILVNKCDLLEVGVDAVAADLSLDNPRAVISQTTRCDIDVEDAVRGTTGCYASDRVEEVGDDTYSSFAFRFDARLHRRPFERWLTSLPDGVIRVKGFVRFAGESGLFEVQATNDRYDIRAFPTVQWIDASLVAITHPMRAENLLAGFSDCIPPPEAV